MRISDWSSDVCSSDLTATTLGFHLGPRINAGGRIGQARLGADLLASDDHVFCEKVAAELNQLNHERRDIENAVLEEATAQVNHDDDIIVVAQKGWHHGVLGIVDCWLKESFNRPAIVKIERAHVYTPDTNDH